MNNVDSISMDSSNVDSLNVDSLKIKGDNARLSFEKIATQILSICQLEYKSADEIAKELKRSVKYLKNNILPKMILAGMLQKLHADYHPNQKFKTKQ